MRTRCIRCSNMFDLADNDSVEREIWYCPVCKVIKTQSPVVLARWEGSNGQSIELVLSSSGRYTLLSMSHGWDLNHFRGCTTVLVIEHINTKVMNGHYDEAPTWRQVK